MSNTNSSPRPYSEDLQLALSLADAADSITMARFEATDLRVESKPDLTPVSDADTAVEKALRDILAAHAPQDAVLGEEFGGHTTLEGRQWVIDPIDGTKNFVRGVPVWATLISLLVDGKPVVGVVSAPALSRRWWAAEGQGAWRSFSSPITHTTAGSSGVAGSGAANVAGAATNGASSSGDSAHHAASGAAIKQLGVSAVAKITDASVAISSLTGWADCGKRDQLIALTDKAWRLRGYGDFWSYMLVAEGAVDVAAEPEVNLWDLAALVPIVEEAGGTFTSVAGETGPHHGSAVATNGLLHSQVIDALR